MNQIVSFSGGKDSTAMLLMMLERGEDVAEIIFFDTGWEFPQMYDHLDMVEKHINRPITRLHSEESLLHRMTKRVVKSKRGGPRIGLGWPSAMNRWCTGVKRDTIHKHLLGVENKVFCVGIASDEAERTNSKSLVRYNVRYPLIEWGVDEPMALSYCQDRGFDWGGLYGVFPRVSCFCCPLKRLDEYRALRKHFPEQWALMLEWDKLQPEENRGFIGTAKVCDLDARFAEEDRQIQLPGMAEAANG